MAVLPRSNNEVALFWAVMNSASTRGRDGRTKLLDAAERLFAERGISGVSLREITEAAGQRNASVVQYHFGSRAGLVAAVVDRRMSQVDADRTTRLDDATRGGRRPGVHEAMRILVEPLAACLETSSGRAYLRIVQHLVDEPAASPAAGRPLTATNPSLRRVSRLLAGASCDLPDRIAAERRHQTTSFVLRALADRAADLDAGRRPRLGHDAFVSNLVDVLVAVLTTPPTSETRRRVLR
jgi:AcrR family transcriptional regulator